MNISFKNTIEYRTYLIACEYYNKNKTKGNFKLYHSSLEKCIDMAQKKYKNIGWNGDKYDWEAL
jgi:hypothetical protein